MKNLIDITDEDVISVIDRIHLLTKNTIIGRKGILGLDFHESYKRYGTAHIDVLLSSDDTVTDGYFSTRSRCRIVFQHKSVWFTEYTYETDDNEISGHNRNHFFGYLKLQELGYILPETPQW